MKKIKQNYMKIIMLCSWVIMIAFFMWCAPLMVDDFSFKSFSNYNIKDKLIYVLQYGNGRLLGNMGVLYLLEFPILRIIIKSIVIISVIILIDKNIQVKGVHTYYLFSFLLILGMDPQMFAQVFTWTSGFQNYVPPVLCMLICMKIALESSEKNKFVKIFILTIIGMCGQLFVEHSTIITLGMAGVILILNLRRRKNINYACVWFGGTAVGTIIMFLIPKLFYVTNENEGYQKLNLTGIKPFVISIFSNTLHISRMYSKNILLWCAISILLIYLMHKKSVKNKISAFVKIILVFYPSYCVVNYLLTQNVWYDEKFKVFHSLILCCMLFAYLVSVIYGIWQSDEQKIKIKALIYLGMAIFSVLPLLIVYPIGERCLFHSYMFMVMLVLLIFKYNTSISSDVFVTGQKKLITISCITLSMCLIFVFWNMHYVDMEKHSYIKEQMTKECKKIFLPKLPYRYVHSMENIMIDEYYFYEEKGDIEFETVDYKEWFKIKEK